jgi:hypothetical protein
MMTNEQIDFSYRPASYFGPTSLPRHLLDKVKGDVVRKDLERLYRDGQLGELACLLQTAGLDKDAVRSLGSVHPALMGGNYLPDRSTNEVEIARIVIRSTTYDVTCLYARFRDGKIRYRVVDEYDGATLAKRKRMSSVRTLELGEMTDFFITAWPMVSVLRMNFGTNLDAALKFFTATSRFYPGFHAACVNRVVAAFNDSTVA